MRAELLLWWCAACGDTLSLGAGRGATMDGSVATTTALAAPAALALGAADKDDDPSLTADRQLLYFNSQRQGGSGREDIWRTQRGSDGRWSPPVPVSELNTADRETGIALSADGLQIWFSSDRPGGAGGLDVYAAERSGREAAFGVPTRVATLSSAADDLISAVDASQQTAYLARRDGEGDDYDLFFARGDGATWSAPEALDELNTAAEESDAYPVEGGARLLFTRAGDLYVSRRSDRHSRYGELARLGAINGEQDERDPWASDDLRYLVFSSDRSGSHLLYESSAELAP